MRSNSSSRWITMGMGTFLFLLMTSSLIIFLNHPTPTNAQLPSLNSLFPPNGLNPNNGLNSGSLSNIIGNIGNNVGSSIGNNGVPTTTNNNNNNGLNSNNFIPTTTTPNTATTGTGVNPTGNSFIDGIINGVNNGLIDAGIDTSHLNPNGNAPNTGNSGNTGTNTGTVTPPTNAGGNILNYITVIFSLNRLTERVASLTASIPIDTTSTSPQFYDFCDVYYVSLPSDSITASYKATLLQQQFVTAEALTKGNYDSTAQSVSYSLSLLPLTLSSQYKMVLMYQTACGYRSLTSKNANLYISKVQTYSITDAPSIPESIRLNSTQFNIDTEHTINAVLTPTQDQPPFTPPVSTATPTPSDLSFARLTAQPPTPPRSVNSLTPPTPTTTSSVSERNGVVQQGYDITIYGSNANYKLTSVKINCIINDVESYTFTLKPSSSSVVNIYTYSGLPMSSDDYMYFNIEYKLSDNIANNYKTKWFIYSPTRILTQHVALPINTSQPGSNSTSSSLPSEKCSACISSCQTSRSVAPKDIQTCWSNCCPGEENNVVGWLNSILQLNPSQSNNLFPSTTDTTTTPNTGTNPSDPLGLGNLITGGTTNNNPSNGLNNLFNGGGTNTIGGLPPLSNIFPTFSLNDLGYQNHGRVANTMQTMQFNNQPLALGALNNVGTNPGVPGSVDPLSSITGLPNTNPLNSVTGLTGGVNNGLPNLGNIGNIGLPGNTNTNNAINGIPLSTSSGIAPTSTVPTTTSTGLPTLPGVTSPITTPTANDPISAIQLPAGVTLPTLPGGPQIPTITVPSLPQLPGVNLNNAFGLIHPDGTIAAPTLPSAISLPVDTNSIVNQLNSLAAQNPSLNINGLFPNLVSTSNPTPSNLIIPLVGTATVGTIPSTTTPTLPTGQPTTNTNNPNSSIPSIIGGNNPSFAPLSFTNRPGSLDAHMQSSQQRFKTQQLDSIFSSLGGATSGASGGFSGALSSLSANGINMPNALSDTKMLGDQWNIQDLHDTATTLPTTLTDTTCFDASCYGRCMEGSATLIEGLGNGLVEAEKMGVPGPPGPPKVSLPSLPSGAVSLTAPALPTASMLPDMPSLPAAPDPKTLFGGLDPSTITPSMMQSMMPAITDKLKTNQGNLSSVTSTTGSMLQCANSCQLQCKSGQSYTPDCSGDVMADWECLGQAWDDLPAATKETGSTLKDLANGVQNTFDQAKTAITPPATPSLFGEAGKKLNLFSIKEVLANKNRKPRFATMAIGIPQSTDPNMMSATGIGLGSTLLDTTEPSTTSLNGLPNLPTLNNNGLPTLPNIGSGTGLPSLPNIGSGTGTGSTINPPTLPPGTTPTTGTTNPPTTTPTTPFKPVQFTSFDDIFNNPFPQNTPETTINALSLPGSTTNPTTGTNTGIVDPLTETTLDFNQRAEYLQRLLDASTTAAQTILPVEAVNRQRSLLASTNQSIPGNSAGSTVIGAIPSPTINSAIPGATLAASLASPTVSATTMSVGTSSSYTQADTEAVAEALSIYLALPERLRVDPGLVLQDRLVGLNNAAMGQKKRT